MRWMAQQWFGMPSSCLCQLMARIEWLDAIVELWLASSKLPSSQCCASGACHIRLTLSSRMRLPCLKMGSGSRSSTNGACTYVAKRSSSWIWTARCAQRRQTDGLISIAHSSSTSHVDARLLSTQMPMRTSSHHRLSGGQSRSPSR